VASYGKHVADSFKAAACLRNIPNQREAALKGGLPPTLSSLYDDPSFIKAYPFGKLIRSEVNNGAVRPVTPAYADVSLAVTESIWPPSDINLNGFVPRLRKSLKDALDSSALL
jgi:multiple sugar transport system substrate-binding protein